MRTLFLFTMLIMSFTALAKQNEVCFRAILATDTCGEGISKSVISDLDNMKKNLYAIAHRLRIKLHIEELKASDCSVHLIKKTLRALQGNANDIVLFYYSGHAGVDPQNNPWPVMQPAGGSNYRGLLGISVVKYFQDNPHRLSIVLLDCCNKSIASGPYASVIRERLTINADENLPGLQTLFLESRGLVIGSGAALGEYGWCTSKGGTFTRGFLKTLKQQCIHKNISWRELFPLISEQCLRLNPKHPQHPIWQYIP